MESNDTWRGALMRDLGLGIARVRESECRKCPAPRYYRIASFAWRRGQGTSIRSERLFQFLP